MALAGKLLRNNAWQKEKKAKGRGEIIGYADLDTFLIHL